jgi:hypothetical protein
MAIVPFPISGSNRLAGAAIIVERFPVPYVGPALRAWPQPNLVPVIPSTFLEGAARRTSGRQDAPSRYVLPCRLPYRASGLVL